jgi:hypothetical protein
MRFFYINYFLNLRMQETDECLLFHKNPIILISNLLRNEISLKS